MAAIVRAPAKTFRLHGSAIAGASRQRALPEETAVAFTYDGGGYAVMMATPEDFSDFALGFSLNEGIVASKDDIAELEVIETDIGIELRLWLRDAPAAAFGQRRRHLAGPTGCGLCGIETLSAAMRPSPPVADGLVVTPADIMAALASLPAAQALNRETRAVHAAGFFVPGTGLVALREDVGRHNALDKLRGALATAGIPGRTGFVVVTSRLSVEMVQKTAALGAPLLVAVSVPTALAVRTAEAAGITLVAVARSDGFEIFTRPDRIRREDAADVA
jgi:FdhD protein